MKYFTKKSQLKYTIRATPELSALSGISEKFNANLYNLQRKLLHKFAKFWHAE